MSRPIPRLGERIYVARYGTPPTHQSRNRRDGTWEAGISVYEVRRGIPQYCGWFFGIIDRPLWRGQGTIVGWGSDGEPLVTDLVVRRVSRRQAQALQARYYATA